MSASSLRSALFTNAVFSTLTGLSLLFFPKNVSGILGFDHPGIFRLLGISLLFHAVMLAWMRNRPTIRGWTKINLGIITPYPIIILTLISFGHIIGTAGIVLAGTDGLVVGLIAVWQYHALKKNML